MGTIDVAGVSEDEPEASGPGVEIDVPLLVFELTQTQVVTIGLLILISLGILISLVRAAVCAHGTSFY
jgi:hypothetical protein